MFITFENRLFLSSSMSLSPFVKNFTNQKYTIETYLSVNELPVEAWDSLIGDFFYGRKAHLSVVEKVQSDSLKFFYVLVKKEERYIAAMYFQYLNFSMENAVNSWQNKNEQKCSLVYPFLFLAKGKQLPLIQSGNLFCTEDNGLYFSPETCEEEKSSIIQEVVDFLTLYIKGGKNMYFMLTGFPVNSTLLKDFHPLEIEPNLILNISSSWNTFDDYVSNMSSKYRQRVKKVMKQTDDFVITSLSLEEIETLEETLLKLYRNVAEHASFNMAYLSKGYFVEYKKLYQDQFLVQAYWKDQQLVGFCSSFFIQCEQYVHFIGMDYLFNEKWPLYHRMLFEFVRTSIQRQDVKIYLGRTATEIKTTIGAEPIPAINLIKIQSAFYKCVLPKILNKFGAKPYIVRSPFKTLEQVQLPA